MWATRRKSGHIALVSYSNGVVWGCVEMDWPSEDNVLFDCDWPKRAGLRVRFELGMLARGKSWWNKATKLQKRNYLANPGGKDLYWVAKFIKAMVESADEV